MDRFISEFVELAQKWLLLAVQVQGELERLQADCELDKVLQFVRLSNPEGVLVSLASLDKAEQYLSVSREAFQQYVLGMTQELTAKLCTSPTPVDQHHFQGFQRKLQENIGFQAAFYEGRQRWIDSAREICRLVEAFREQAIFDEGTVYFHDDNAIDRFNQLLGDIDDIHNREVALMNLRKATIDYWLGRGEPNT